VRHADRAVAVEHVVALRDSGGFGLEVAVVLVDRRAPLC
jgi:hypothetical protein